MSQDPIYDHHAALEELPAPAPGPVWTNGAADRAAAEHPSWCDRFHSGPGTSGRWTHFLELLAITVSDVNLIEDVPLTVVLERVDDEDDGPGETKCVISVGHMLYQPQSVVVSGADRARIIGALTAADAIGAR